MKIEIPDPKGSQSNFANKEYAINPNVKFNLFAVLVIRPCIQPEAYLQVSVYSYLYVALLTLSGGKPHADCTEDRKQYCMFEAHSIQVILVHLEIPHLSGDFLSGNVILLS